jgi:hypothetical protein
MKMRRPTAANLFLGALTASTLLGGAAHSAELVVDRSLIIGSQNHSSKPETTFYNVYLTGAKPGFAATIYQTTDKVDGPAFTVDFSGTIQGYHFFTTKPANTIGTLISKGVSISATTTSTKFDTFGSPPGKIWVTSNPGADLFKPATGPDLFAGIRDLTNVSGSIDISGLASGTVYFFYGAHRSKPSITAGMIDSDGPEPAIMLLEFHNGDSANNGERYMSSLTFVNDAGYDTIEFDLSAPAVTWDGVVVTGKVIP